MLSSMPLNSTGRDLLLAQSPWTPSSKRQCDPRKHITAHTNGLDVKSCSVTSWFWGKGSFIYEEDKIPSCQARSEGGYESPAGTSPAHHLLTYIKLTIDLHLKVLGKKKLKEQQHVGA